MTPKSYQTGPMIVLDAISEECEQKSSENGRDSRKFRLMLNFEHLLRLWATIFRFFRKPRYTLKMLNDIVSSLNKIIKINGTRKFQDEIISSGTISVLCPMSNKILYPTHNFFMPSPDSPFFNVTIYIFEGVERFALISTNLARGNPILAATTKTVSSKNNCFFHENKWRYEPLIRLGRSVLNEISPQIPKIDSRLKPKLLCGHHNFVHLFCNELPTIDDVIVKQRDVEIYLFRDPFGFRKQPPYSRLVTFLDSADTFLGWNTSLILTGTSSYVSDKVRLRLLQSIIKENLPKSRRIYITVRPSSLFRSNLNEVNFLCALILEFKKKYNDMEFVLDGFSMPNDFHLLPRQSPLREQYIKRVEQSRSLTRSIFQTVPSAQESIKDITGMTLTDALEIISSCSYYVGHAGSQQHKIAWFFPRNGFIHSNQVSITDSAMQRDSSQSECSILPSKPDPLHIEDVEYLPSEHQNTRYYHPRNKKYIIKEEHVSSVVNQIINDYWEKVICQAEGSVPANGGISQGEGSN